MVAGRKGLRMVHKCLAWKLTRVEVEEQGGLGVQFWNVEFADIGYGQVGSGASERDL